MRTKDMVGALDQERSEVDVASLGNAKLWVAVPGLTAISAAGRDSSPHPGFA